MVVGMSNMLSLVENGVELGGRAGAASVEAGARLNGGRGKRGRAGPH